MFSRSRFLGAGAAAALSGLAGVPAGSRDAAAADLDQVTIGTTSASSDAPFFIADKLGYFREAGIAAKFITFVGAPLMVAPLGVGQLDVGSGAPSASFFNAVARGIDVRIVADKASCPPGYGQSPLVVRTDLVKSGRYKTPRDLKGMRIAEPAPGGSTAATLNRLLASVGIPYADVTHVYLSFPDQVAALAGGSLDASLLSEPSATIAERAGTGIRVLSNDTWYPNQELATLFYGSTMLKRSEVAVRFMTAWLRGARFYNDALLSGHLRGKNAPRVIDILTTSTPITNREIYSGMVSHAVNPDGKVNVATLSDDLAFYKSGGFITGTITVPQAVDLQYQAAAVKALGPYKRPY